MTCIHAASGALHTLPVQTIYEADDTDLRLFLNDLRRIQTIVHNELAMREIVRRLQGHVCVHGISHDQYCEDCGV